MTFSIKADRASLRNVNLGADGSGEGMTPRIDMKFVFNASSEILKTLFNSEAEGCDVLFWTNGEVYPGMEQIKLHSVWDHCRIKFGAFEDLMPEDVLSAVNVRVKGVSMKPMPLCLLEVTLTVQLRDPTDEHLHKAATFQKMDGCLEINQYDEVTEDGLVDADSA